MPAPSATNFSSAAFAWTNTTSAAPRRPVSSAWPVPCATTRTAIPVLSRKIGRMWPKRPDCSVEVVEATVMNVSCAPAGADSAATIHAAATAACVTTLISILPLRAVGSPQQFALQEGARRTGSRPIEELVGGRVFQKPAVVQEEDVVGEAPRLDEVVRRHDDGHAVGMKGLGHLLHRAAGRRVERLGGPVEEEHFGAERPGARPRPPTLPRSAARRVGTERVSPR